MRQNTLWFNQVGLNDVSLVGGKCASLGEMIQNLSGLGIRVPNGFAVTCDAYQYFLEFNNLVDKVKQKLNEIDYQDEHCLRKKAHEIRQLIQNGEFPSDLESEILQKYNELSQHYLDETGHNSHETDVAVRSSATTEDLGEASFAGQQDTFLNVCGKKNLLEKIKGCFASVFNERAIDYRHNLNFDGFDIKLSVGIQKMVRSDLGSAGVAFSIDTESGNQNVVVINSSYGLGEMVVSGQIEPDEVMLFKPTLKEGYPSIIDKKLGNKTVKMVYNDSIDKRTKIIPVNSEKQPLFSISNEHAIELGKWVLKLEDYYSQVKGHWCPVDCEWAIDGNSNELFIVQSRPETVHSNANKNMLIQYNFLQDTPIPIAEGIAITEKIGSGQVKIILDIENYDEEFNEGDILVTTFTSPDFEPLMKKASAVIAEVGGRSSHCAIICRELQIPCVTGVPDATKLFKNNQVVTVSCNQGSTGFIYNGFVPFEKTETPLENLPDPPVKINMNVASPNEAFNYAKIPNQGVGLCRLEFIINNYIKVHPLALINVHQLENEKIKSEILELISGYQNPQDYFIEKMVYGLSRIGAAFYPHDVIVRTSDFKSNEYANLLGGSLYEPHEENPMIGWRGAVRYYSKEYRPAFDLECRALKIVRDTIGLTNIHVMFPFVRTVKELKNVQEILALHGLERGNNGLKHALMCELTSNVILADDFAPHIDYASIGSNDLQMSAIMCSRDDALVQHLYNEEEPCLERLISMAIKTYQQHGVKVGICGERPSIDLDFFNFLVKEGIDSISLSPHSVIKTLMSLKK